MRTKLICLLCSAVFLAFTPIHGKKTGIRLSVDKNSSNEDEEMAKGSFMVASQCEDCNNGYRIDQVMLSGYDKPRRSAVETFFITNNTDRPMTGLNLYIEYLTPDGRQLHKRYVRLICDIPPGETRLAEVSSWDRQKSFYFEKSETPKSGGSPYTVIFDPVAFYLRF